MKVVFLQCSMLGSPYSSNVFAPSYQKVQVSDKKKVTQITNRKATGFCRKTWRWVLPQLIQALEFVSSKSSTVFQEQQELQADNGLGFDCCC